MSASIVNARSFDPAESVVILSEPRGGSTWLMELLAGVLDVAIAWEPLHATKGVAPSEFGWGWRPSANPGEDSNPYREFFRSVHGYELHNDWTRMKLTPRAARTAKRVLVKYVRANELIDVLLQSVDFRSPPIVLLRHPVDTCLSQMRAFGDSGPSIHDRLREWCETNCPIIDRPGDDVLLVHYEDLVLRPVEELTRIVAAIGVSPVADIAALDFARASATDFDGDMRADPTRQLDKNLSALSVDEQTAIQAIFDEFGLTRYSAFAATPQRS